MMQADGSRRDILKAMGSLGLLAAVPAAARAQRPVKPALDPLLAMPGHELAGAIASRKVSSVEAMTAVLDRIERINPRVNAIIALQRREELLGAAQAMDARIAAGNNPGPLAGLPWAVKDLQDVNGITSTMGTLVNKGRVPTKDGIMVERLRKAGALFIGKTNVPEFGFGSHTYNPIYGATGNAFDASRTAGGSSGGAAVSLALRMLPIADGSDFGGSLRNPAAWNNVFGFRPGIGTVPQEGSEQWISNMGVLGPMARTVRDLALLLSVQAGPHAQSPLSAELDPAQFMGSLDMETKGKRIGWIGDWGGQVPHDPEVLSVCRGALSAFAAMGCEVDEVRPDIEVEPVWQATHRLRSWMLAGRLIPLVDAPANKGMFGPQVLWEVENGRNLTGVDVMKASAVRTAYSRAIDRLFDHFDFLVTPAVRLFPFPITETWPTEVAGQTMRTYHEWMLGCFLVTMTGLPALAAPAGFSKNGLPTGIQIISRRHAEMDCLRIAHAYEQAQSAVIGRLSPLMG